MVDGRPEYVGEASGFLSFEGEEEAAAAQEAPPEAVAEENGAVPHNDADADDKDAKTEEEGTKGRRRISDVRKIIEEEKRKEGRVSLRTYWTYIRSSSIIGWIIVILLILLARANGRSYITVLQNLADAGHVDLATQWALKVLLHTRFVGGD